MSEKIETGLGIYQKLSEVRKRLPRIAKNGVGPATQGGYKFVSIDDILEAVVPLENEVGIVSYPVDHHVDFHYNTAEMKSDGRVPRENVQAIVGFTFRYVSVEDGSFVDVSVPGEGIDTQDKGTRKAVTQAQKIANILTYNIITGEEDPDAVDGGRVTQEARPPALRKAVSAAVKDDGVAKLKERIRVEFIEGKGVPKETVNSLVSEGKTAGKTGEALYQAVIIALEGM